MDEEKLKSYIENIRDWLRDLAEDRTDPMDVNVYNTLWCRIQTIDHDLKNKFKEVK